MSKKIAAGPPPGMVFSAERKDFLWA